MKVNLTIETHGFFDFEDEAVDRAYDALRDAGFELDISDIKVTDDGDLSREQMEGFAHAKRTLGFTNG